MGAAGSSLELPVERDDMKPYVEKLTKIQAKLESGEAWTVDERDAVRDAVRRGALRRPQRAAHGAGNPGYQCCDRFCY